jgi:CelD/BcsL family acetyltransferase involved in cellulose biosynthesis
MRVLEVNDYSDLLELKATWKSILEKCPHNVFSTWEWNSIWWKHFGAGRKLFVLVAQEENRVVGLAPLMYSVKSVYGAKQGKIEFIGTPQADYNNFIISEKKEKCIQYFLEYLKEVPEKWDCIELTDVPQDSICLPSLRKVSDEIEAIEDCPYLPLPSSFEAFMESLSYKKRKYVRRGLRKLESSFNVELTDCSQTESYIDGMHALFELHQKTWAAVGQKGVLCDSAVREFHLELAEAFSQKGWLCLHTLKLSDAPVAVEYGFRYGSKYYAYLPGLDPKYREYSAGNMLFIKIIEKLIKDNVKIYDFLRGSEAYKHYWNAIPKPNYRIVISKPGSMAKMQHWCFNSYFSLGSKLNYVVNLKSLPFKSSKS